MKKGRGTYHFLLLTMLSLALSSCYTHRVVGLLQDDPKLPQYEKAKYEPYRLAVNDEVVYRLITMDETIAKAMQSQTNGNDVSSYRVYSDGTVDIPFLEPVRLEGLTLKEAEDTLRNHLRQIIPDAEVKVSLYNKTFTIIGDINSGTFNVYKDKLTIFQALAMSGDLANSGDRRHVRIIRPHGNDEPEVLEFDIRSNTVIDSKYYYVYPNDVIYVSRSPGSFYKVSSYSGFVAIVTSSLSLLIAVLNYTTLF